MPTTDRPSRLPAVDRNGPDVPMERQHASPHDENGMAVIETGAAGRAGRHGSICGKEEALPRRVHAYEEWTYDETTEPSTATDRRRVAGLLALPRLRKLGLHQRSCEGRQPHHRRSRSHLNGRGAVQARRATASHQMIASNASGSRPQVRQALTSSGSTSAAARPAATTLSPICSKSVTPRSVKGSIRRQVRAFDHRRR